MACPTCSHTVQRVNEGVSSKVWWCPRCGTIKMDAVPESEEPKLVQYATSLCDEVMSQCGLSEDVLRWVRAVREATLLPKEREQGHE